MAPLRSAGHLIDGAIAEGGCGAAGGGGGGAGPAGAPRSGLGSGLGRHVGQRPSNSGFCLATNAVTALRWSAVPPQIAWACASAASASESVPASPMDSSPLIAPYATVG